MSQLQGLSKSSDDAGVKEALLALGSTLRAVQRILEENVDESLKSMRRDAEASDHRLRRMEVRLEEVSKSVGGIGPRVEEIAQAVGIDKQNVSAGDDEEDRKRIKERLREVLETNYERVKRNNVKKTFIEYFFGICKTNGREGKVGSRFVFILKSRFAPESDAWIGRLIHPQSVFMEGCRPGYSHLNCPLAHWIILYCLVQEC